MAEEKERKAGEEPAVKPTEESWFTRAREASVLLLSKIISPASGLKGIAWILPKGSGLKEFLDDMTKKVEQGVLTVTQAVASTSWSALARQYRLQIWQDPDKGTSEVVAIIIDPKTGEPLKNQEPIKTGCKNLEEFSKKKDEFEFKSFLTYKPSGIVESLKSLDFASAFSQLNSSKFGAVIIGGAIALGGALLSPIAGIVSFLIPGSGVVVPFIAPVATAIGVGFGIWGFIKNKNLWGGYSGDEKLGNLTATTVVKTDCKSSEKTKQPQAGQNPEQAQLQAVAAAAASATPLPDGQNPTPPAVLADATPARTPSPQK